MLEPERYELNEPRRYTFELERRDFMMSETSDITKDGMVELSEKPGFGVELDEKKLSRTRFA